MRPSTLMPLTLPAACLIPDPPRSGVEQRRTARITVYKFRPYHIEKPEKDYLEMSRPLPESCAEPAEYTSVPVKISAARWDGTEEHARELCDWIDSHRGRGSSAYIPEREPVNNGYNTRGLPLMLERPAHIIVGNPDGNMKLFAGSWLIRDTEEEFYPCKDSVFQRKYRRTRKGAGMRGTAILVLALLGFMLAVMVYGTIVALVNLDG
jgi:hypothetical protein